MFFDTIEAMEQHLQEKEFSYVIKDGVKHYAFLTPNGKLIASKCINEIKSKYMIAVYLLNRGL